MQKLCAFILFYLVIGCHPTSVYADLFMWIDENGIKHFSNTATNDEGKNIRQEEEIKFDEAKYQESLEQQKALEEQQDAEKDMREEKEFKEREIQAVNKLEKAIREEKDIREKEIRAINKLEEKIKQTKEARYHNSSSFEVVHTPRDGKSSARFENNPHTQKSGENNSNTALENRKRKEYEEEVQRVNKYNKEVAENNSKTTLENQKRKEYEEEVQRVNKYNKEVDEYNSQQNKGVSPFNVKKDQNQDKTGGINFRKPYLGKQDPNRSYFERHPLGR